MPQLALTQCIHIHPYSDTLTSRCYGAEVKSTCPSTAPIDAPLSNLKSSLPCALLHSPELYRAIFTHYSSQKTESIQKQQLLSPGWAQIHLPRVYPSAAVECVTPCPGAITVPLHTRFPQFITTIGACQLLLMIAQPLPMKETIDWQRGWGGWGLPLTLPVFFSVF